MPRARRSTVRRSGATWTRRQLDDAYDQDVYAPNRPLIVTRRIASAERARAILGQPERIAYGPSEYEQLDIFRALSPPAPASGGGKGGGAPVNVFVHGGAWRRNKGPDYHALAEPLVRAGAHSVILDFINVEQASGDLMPMYEQVRRAIAWTWRNADKFWRRPRAALYLGAFIGLASCGHAYSPTAGGRKACRRISAKARCC